MSNLNDQTTEKSNLNNQIAEKRKVLRSEYGGMMSLNDLTKEISSDPANAKQWGMDIGAAVKIGSGRVKYDVDVVAKRIVMLRGMC